MLRPMVMAPGHRQPIAGEYAPGKLSQLAVHFDEVARPYTGRYAAWESTIDSGIAQAHEVVSSNHVVGNGSWASRSGRLTQSMISAVLLGQTCS